jgi:DNA invertase Pin-like site-specific DNA recombinase
MIGNEKLAEIRRLLDEGVHSERRIAEIVGVSRGTVRAIASDPTVEQRRADARTDRLPKK